jgi:hypothetical protein
LRLLVLTVLLGSMAAVVAIRSGVWTVKADQLEAARLQLEKAREDLKANPNTESAAKLQAAINAYKAVLAASGAPAAPAQSEFVPYDAQATAFAETAKLSEMAPPEPSPSIGKIANKKKGEANEIPFRNRVPGPTNTNDPVIQGSIIPGLNLVTNPIQNFDGIDMDSQVPIFGGRFAPPDTNADVGPNHVVMAINSAVQVYNKTGTALTAVAPLSSLFSALGPPFNTLADGNDGDAIVLYDPLADRWLISEFFLTITPVPGTPGVTHQLIAISKTGDPTGQYFAYAFPMPPGRFNDYPHFGVWPDAYYMTDNGFNFALTAFLGGGFYAFNRNKMLAGDPTANYIFFGNCGVCPPNAALANSGGLLPADIDGVVTPPVGTPNLFIEFRADEFGDPADALRIYEFRTNFTNPSLSSLTIRPDLPTAAFDARTFGARGANIEQPSPGEALEGLADRLMHRLAYRTLSGGVQSYVLNFTVNVSGVNPTTLATYQGGVRWTELRRDPATGNITINQQATFAPGAGSGTGRDLWMAGIAQDGEGNIGLGASASQASPALNPTAIYTGRLAGDPANTLPQGEVDALAAVTRGVQTATSGRWGDYSSMSVDPSDECTFWGAFEYVDAPTATFDWNTRIFSFKVNPTCVTPAKGTIQGQATNLSAGGAPLPDVSVTTTDGFFRSTDATGNYSMTVAPGTYTVTCSKFGFTTSTGTVTVAGGGTATFNCALQGIPVLAQGAGTLTAEDCATDGKADPGETVTVSLCVTNNGGAATTNLVGTLGATGGVTNPSAPQSYGAIAPGATVCRNFTFRVNPALTCGTNVVASLALQDGATSFGAFNYTFLSGQFLLSASENFDGVIAPALPSGWTAANAVGPTPLWVTSTSTVDTAPNTAFVNDPAVVSDKRLDSVLYNIMTNQARLVFRNNFSLESGFDGGVLEASVNGAAFVDVTDASVGGTFTTGGYTSTISTSFMSPIGGRMAWSGSSGGYITTTVQFGAALQGKSVRFRWRMGSDSSVSGTGWRVDTIQLFDGFACCLKLTPVATLDDPAACTGPGNNIAGTIRVTNPGSSTLTNGTITASLPVAQPGNPQGLPAGTPLLLGIDGCTATVGGNPVGTCTVSTSAITWQGSLTGNATLTINYFAQVGDVPSGTQMCVVTSGGFTGVGLTPVTTCITANCTAVGPGSIIPTIAPGDGASPPSDLKPGSVLFYNIYTSATDPNRQNTRISLTNIEPTRPAFIHLFFVDGSTCSVADAFLCLTANQTVTFLASDLDPGTTGYIVAVAVDRNGCPINFNYLIGDEYVKFASGHQGSLAAEAIPAIAGSFTPCTGAETNLLFDGVAYAPVPRVLAMDNVGSRADGNDTLVIVNRVGGDLLTTAATLRTIFGVMYDDAENALSFAVDPRVCQFRASVGNNFPRTTPRYEQAVPAGRTAWFKFYSTLDQGLFGAAINLNANANASAGAVNGAHNLHKLNFTTSMRYTIPVLPVSCQ